MFATQEKGSLSSHWVYCQAEGKHSQLASVAALSRAESFGLLITVVFGVLGRKNRDLLDRPVFLVVHGLVILVQANMLLSSQLCSLQSTVALLLRSGRNRNKLAQASPLVYLEPCSG